MNKQVLVNDDHRFPTVHIAAGKSINININVLVEKFQRSSSLRNIKYNCVVLLFLRQMYKCINYAKFIDVPAACYSDIVIFSSC